MKAAALKGKAGLDALFDPRNSEFYALWAGVSVRLVGHYFPAVMEQIDIVARVVSDGQLGGAALTAGLLGYAALRAASKAVKK